MGPARRFTDEERRERMAASRRRWREKNRDRERENERIRSQKWRDDNPSQSRADQIKYRERGRKIINEAKGVPCVDCDGRFPPAAMDFDHVHGEKVAAVGKMVTFSEAKLRAEIAKCEVRCANCHRIKHAAGGDEAVLALQSA